jgi:pimeloyl-ACP methyl ester carboxylesterase
MVAGQIALHEALGGDGEAILIAHDWGAVGAWGAAGKEPGRWRRCIILNIPPFCDLRREHRHLRPDQALVLLLVRPDAAGVRGRDLGRQLRVHRPDLGDALAEAAQTAGLPKREIAQTIASAGAAPGASSPSRPSAAAAPNPDPNTNPRR